MLILMNIFGNDIKDFWLFVGVIFVVYIGVIMRVNFILMFFNNWLIISKEKCGVIFIILVLMRKNNVVMVMVYFCLIVFVICLVYVVFISEIRFRDLMSNFFWNFEIFKFFWINSIVLVIMLIL